MKHRKGSLPEWRRSLFIILRTIQLISIRITMRRSSPLSIRRGCHCDSKHILPGCNQSGVDFQKIRRELHPIRVIHCFFRAKSPFGCRFQDFFSTSTPISANRVYISEKISQSYTQQANFLVFSGQNIHLGVDFKIFPSDLHPHRQNRCILQENHLYHMEKMPIA